MPGKLAELFPPQRFARQHAIRSGIHFWVLAENAKTKKQHIKQIISKNREIKGNYSGVNAHQPRKAGRVAGSTCEHLLFILLRLFVCGHYI